MSSKQITSASSAQNRADDSIVFLNKNGCDQKYVIAMTFHLPPKYSLRIRKQLSHRLHSQWAIACLFRQQSIVVFHVRMNERLPRNKSNIVSLWLWLTMIGIYAHIEISSLQSHLSFYSTFELKSRKLSTEYRIAPIRNCSTKCPNLYYQLKYDSKSHLWIIFTCLLVHSRKFSYFQHQSKSVALFTLSTLIWSINYERFVVFIGWWKRMAFGYLKRGRCSWKYLQFFIISANWKFDSIL